MGELRSTRHAASGPLTDDGRSCSSFRAPRMSLLAPPRMCDIDEINGRESKAGSSFDSSGTAEGSRASSFISGRVRPSAASHTSTNASVDAEGVGGDHSDALGGSGRFSMRLSRPSMLATNKMLPDQAENGSIEKKVDRAASPAPPPPATDLLDLTAPFRNKLLVNIHSVWKSCVLGDPDMWQWWKSFVESCIDTVWVDIEHEVERRITNSLSGMPAENTDEIEGPTAENAMAIVRYWLKFRAYVLHHYLAHNRSFFGKLKDPVYLFMFFCTAAPINGLRVVFFALVLAMLLVPGPPDEFQLVNYILVFKGTQFITSGFAGMASGAFRYFMCYTFLKDSFLECVEKHGPGSGMTSGQIGNYIGSICLVWLAFFFLPTSTKQATLDKSRNSAPPPKDTWQKLRWLLYYDMACFALSLVSLTFLGIVTCAVFYWTNGSFEGLMRDRQLHANLFWCNVLYSLLSLPFFLMKWVPGALAVVTHTTLTGYNVYGACVAFSLRVSLEASETPVAPAGPPAWTAGPVAQTVTWVLRLAERGKVARGETYNGEVEMADIVAGMFPKTVGFWTRRRKGKARPDNEDSQNRTQVAATSAEGASSGSALSDSSHLRRRFWRSSSPRPRADCAGSFTNPTPVAASQPSSPLDRGRNGSELSASFVRQEPSHFELALTAGEKVLLTALCLPPDAITQLDGTTYFGVEVASADGSTWRVSRRYGEFRELASRLGKRSLSYAQAPFPPKLVMTACMGPRLESRRRSLEAWLRTAAADSALGASSQGDGKSSWASHICDFLEETTENFLEAPRPGAAGLSAGTAGLAAGLFDRSEPAASVSLGLLSFDGTSTVGEAPAITCSNSGNSGNRTDAEQSTAVAN
eukprot:TRINITY_DN27214_c0_g1_i1.p1 TRINITY_DN27214_c0_g1~~TRINITY_DN27214_c0_g1_i1.p1  ORF type:complete len:865 (-),score=135.70 TRINITY_DN27214_c0_g1_i1:87-2681(-)